MLGLKLKMKDKNVMVTGGAGFIGSHLVDRLLMEGVQNVIIVDDLSLGSIDNIKEPYEKIHFYQQDASDFLVMDNILNNHKIDVVFNLAVTPLIASLDSPKQTFHNNVEIVSTFCELLRLKRYETLIHFSSSEVYGTAEYTPMDEGHPLNGLTPYAASKSAGDLLIYSYGKTFGIDYSIVRPFNNYGPRQNSGKFAGVIPVMINKALNNETIQIEGDGSQTRDFIYVEDTIHAAIEIYKNVNTRSTVINVGSGENISINEIASFIQGYFGKDNIEYIDERIGDVYWHLADIQWMQDIIRFTPKVKFEEGIKRTIEWYVNNQLEE